MPLISKILSIFVLGAVFSSAIPSGAFAKVINDGIIAIVNDDVITLKDLRQYIDNIYGQLKVEGKSPEEIKEIMSAYQDEGLNKLIDDKLILGEANAKGLELRPDMINKRVKEIKDHYSSEDEFLAVLDSQGLTVTDLRQKITDQMKAKYIVEEEVRSKIMVNPQEVTKYYEAHPDEFQRKPSRDLLSIYISFSRGKEQARNRASEARSRWTMGEDFELLFKEFSELPSVGKIETGQMVPAIEQEIFKLNLGEISSLVEVPDGIYLFKVVGISPGKTQAIKEVKDRIYEKLYNEAFKQKFTAWIEKLREKAYVEIKQ